MKVGFLIGEISQRKGQTNNIIEIIDYLHSRHKDWEFVIFTNKVLDKDYSFIKHASVVLLHRYYLSLIGWRELEKKLHFFDVLYVKGNFPYLIPAVRSGVPTILVVHQIDSPKLFRGLIPKLRIIAANFMVREMVNKPTELVTVSNELAQFYKTTYGRLPKAIPDQISKVFFSSNANRESLTHEVVKLLSVGYWDGYNGRKRQDVLLELIGSMQKSSLRIELTLVGLGIREIEDLKEIATRLGIIDIVHFKGGVSKENLVQEYISSDVYVTATTYEGFYRQLVEAFSTGMPAIVYDARLDTRDLSQCASVNHVLKSRAGELFFDSMSFKDALFRVVKNYKNYSEKAINYSTLYLEGRVGKMTEDLLSYTINKPKSQKVRRR